MHCSAWPGLDGLNLNLKWELVVSYLLPSQTVSKPGLIPVIALVLVRDFAGHQPRPGVPKEERFCPSIREPWGREPDQKVELDLNWPVTARQALGALRSRRTPLPARSRGSAEYTSKLCRPTIQGSKGE